MERDGDRRTPPASLPADAALRAELERYAALVEHAPDAIVILDVGTGHFVSVNAAAEQLFRMDRERLLRLGPADVSPPVQPDGRASRMAAADYVQRALEGERPRFDWTHQRSDGRRVECEVSLLRLPSPDRVLVRGSLLDVSERREAEQARAAAAAALAARAAAEAAAAQLRGMVAGLNAVVLERDPVTWQLRFVNERITEILGHTRERWLTDPDLWSQAIHPEDRAAAIGTVRAAIADGSDYSLTYRAQAADGRQVWLQHLGHVTRDDEGRATALHAVLIDVTEQKRREHAARLLAAVGRILSGPGTVEERLGAVAALAVGPLCDWSEVWLRGDDDRFRAVAGAPEAMARRLLALPPFPLPVALRDAVAAGGPFVVPEVAAELDRAATGDEEQEAMRGLGSLGGLVVPLVAGGQVVGLLTLAGTQTGRRYDEADLSLAGELGQRISAMVAAERLAAQQRALHAITVALSAAGTAAEAAAELTAGLQRVLGAGVVSVCRVAPDGLLHTVDVVGYPEERLAPFAAMRLSASFPLTDAARTGQAVWLPDRAAWIRRYPDVSDRLGPRTQAGAALPLTVGDRVVGAVGVSFDAPRAFTPDERSFLLTVTGQVALAFERAALADVRREMAETLQRSLLPGEPPQLDRLAVTASYLPAVEGTSAGGDWYDVLPLDGGRVAIAVGDVVGNGAPAAAVMGQLRSALAALLLEGHGPARALELLERFAGSVPGAGVTTVACLLLDPATGRLTVSRAGHPPPLVVAADRSYFLDEGLGPALGIFPGAPRPAAEAVLPPGAILVVFTDGLVERRGTSLDDGLAMLAQAAVARSGASLPELVEGVVGELVDRVGASDDIALVAARRLPAPLHVELPSDPVHLRRLRRSVHLWAREAGLDPDTTEDLHLALGEAVANAVEHAYRDTGGAGPVTVSVHQRDDGGLTATVQDRGRWRPVATDPGFRGRGLQMIRALGTDVAVDPGPDGTTVRFRLPGPGADAGSDAAGPPVTEPAERGVDVLSSDHDGRHWLEIVGDLDLAAVPAVRSALLAGLAGPGPVTVDLRRIGHLASVGLGLLLEAVRSGVGRPDLELLLPDSGPARRALDLAGLTAALRRTDLPRQD